MEDVYLKVAWRTITHHVIIASLNLHQKPTGHAACTVNIHVYLSLVIKNLNQRRVRMAKESQEVAYDFLGNEIRVGDEVVYTQLHYRCLKRGKIRKITPCTVNIACGHAKGTKQFHNQVVKIENRRVFNNDNKAS
jgi:hypothetical protein